MTLSTDHVLTRLQSLRRADAPTHGGKLFSYVYDSGLSDLDELAAQAMRLALPVNGLDPTMFPSVPAMEKDLIAFAQHIFGAKRWRGSRKVFGSITSGGTESCMLAVKTARDLWRERGGHGTARLIAPVTAHAAFQKAAHYFGLELDLVPVSPDGVVRAQDLIERFGADVALVVVSAPSYPTAQLDPVAEVAAAAHRQGISCHVDACIGGFALPFLKRRLPVWDMRLEGVTSLSADLHKYGYAPKGASILLQRGRARHRHQFFATKRWPGYPVVNPTLLGSRSATSLAAAWAITSHLGVSGYERLIGQAERSTASITEAVHQIQGLRVMGAPTGPLLALTTDELVPRERQVDPHRLADHMSKLGFLIQHQPGLTLSNGVRMAHSVHLTITPVTASTLPEFIEALHQSADAVRGVPRATAKFELTALRLLGMMRQDASITAGQAGLLLKAMGVGAGSGLPSHMATLMRVIEELPDQVAHTILTEVIARLSEPR